MIQILNRLLDAALGVNSRAVLNDDDVASPAVSLEIAAEVKHAVDAIKTDAFDDSTGRLSYTCARSSDAYN